MLLYPLAALVTPFPRIFIVKVNANNSRNPPCPFPALMVSFPTITLINGKATGCINEEAAIGAIIAPRYPPFWVFLCFTVLLALSIKRPESLQFYNFNNIFHIFEMNKVNPFSVLRAPVPLTFFQVYLI